MRRHTQAVATVLIGCALAGFTALPAHPETFSLRLDTKASAARGATDAAVRFRWLHWWEAHHRDWLDPQGSADALRPTADRTRTAAALLDAARSHPEPAVRAAAVVALGRLRPADLDPAALLLGEAAGGGFTRDPEPRVRQAAWVACGLLADPRCVAALTDPPPVDGELEAVAQTVAIGLLPTLPPEVAPDLTRRLVDRVRRGVTDEERRMALWALQTHGVEPPLDALFATVAADSVNPTLTQQSLTDRDVNRRLNRDAWLRDLAEANPRGRDVAAWRAIEDDDRVGSVAVHGSRPSRLKMELQTAAVAAWGRQAAIDQGKLWRRTLRTLALEAVDGPLRTPSEPGVTVDRSVSTQRGSHMLRGAALIALARQTDGEDDDLDTIFDALDGKTRVWLRDRDAPETSRGTVRDPDALVRGYAAVALGIVAARLDPEHAAVPPGLRRLDLPAHEVDRFRRRAARQLTQTLDQRRGGVGLRSAAAVGLGLTGDPGNAPALREAADTLRPGDAMLAGHLALALAMLDDDEAPPLAARLLTDPRLDADHDEVVLGRRAAARALRRLGHAAPADADLDAGWVTLELVTLGHALGDHRLTDTLLDRLAGDDPEDAWVAATALGRLHDADPTPRLDRLARHVNPTTTFRRRAARDRADRVLLLVPPGWPARDFHGLSQPMLYHDLLTRTAPND
ncbi:MAG: hypothetical protein AAF710_05560 [Planctomycetota bacterium]